MKSSGTDVLAMLLCRVQGQVFLLLLLFINSTTCSKILPSSGRWDAPRFYKDIIPIDVSRLSGHGNGKHARHIIPLDISTLKDRDDPINTFADVLDDDFEMKNRHRIRDITGSGLVDKWKSDLFFNNLMKRAQKKTWRYYW